MRNNPTISIILAAIDGDEKYFADAVRSGLEQTYRNIQLVIVHDGADDRIPGITKQFADSRIKYVRREGKSETSVLWNDGIRESAGDYLVPLTGAEQLGPRAVEEMLSHAHSGPDGHFVYTDFYIDHIQSGRREKVDLPAYADTLNIGRISPCFLFSRKLYDSVGRFSRRYAPMEAYDFWIRAAERFKLIHCSDPLAVTRAFPDKIKFEDLLQISLMESVIRYCRKYAELNGLMSPTDSLLRRLWWSKRGVVFFLKILAKVFLKLTGLSPAAGLYFAFAVCGIIVKSLFYPYFLRMQKILFRFRINVLRRRLKTGRNQINVVCLVPELVIGGSEKVVGDIVRELKPKGYHFYLLTSRGEKNNWCRDLLKAFDGWFLLSKKLRDPDKLNEERYYFYLSRIIKRLDIKIVLISNAPQGYKAVNRLKKDFPGTRIVDILHVERYAGTADEVLPYVPQIDRRICISHHLKDHILEKYQSAGIDRRHIARIEVIYNGNDMDGFDREEIRPGGFRLKYGIDSRAKIISYVGRLSCEKRPLLVVDIAQRLIGQDPGIDCKFVMAGDGRELKAVKRRIKDYGLQKYFILTGMVTKQTIQELLADSFAVLITSYIEGLPLVLVEAMAMNVPVITTDVGAVREVVRNDVNGFFVDPQEHVVESMTAIIFNLLRSPDKHFQIAEKTRKEVVSKFSLGVMRDRYSRAFAAVLGQDESSAQT